MASSPANPPGLPWGLWACPSASPSKVMRVPGPLHQLQHTPNKEMNTWLMHGLKSKQAV